MRLTKRHARKTDINGQHAKPIQLRRVEKLDLELLADFLNFSYAGGGEKPFKQKDPLSRLKQLHPFAEDFEFDSAWEDTREIAKLQLELVQVLDPLIGRQLKNQRLVKARLERLIAKINSLDLRFRWNVEPADKERLIPDFHPRTGKPIPKTERKIRPWQDSGHAIFKIWQTKWIVTKSIVRQWSRNIQSLRKLLFGIIVTNLENRQLSGLKRCGWCRKFFVTPDRRSNYCTADHQKLHARGEAKINMQQRRADEKKQKDEERREAEKRAKRREKESKLLIPFKSLLGGGRLPVSLVSNMRKWKANGRRQAKEILENLSEAELDQLERVLLRQSQ